MGGWLAAPALDCHGKADWQFVSLFQKNSMSVTEVQLLVARARHEADNPAFKVRTYIVSFSFWGRRVDKEHWRRFNSRKFGADLTLHASSNSRFGRRIFPCKCKRLSSKHSGIDTSKSAHTNNHFCGQPT